MAIEFSNRVVVTLNPGQYIISKNNITAGSFTIGNSITKDMLSTTAISGIAYFGNTYPGTSAPTASVGSYWGDWGNDIFDSWGWTYIYDYSSNKYAYINIPTANRNGSDGTFYTETINLSGRIFTVKHGYPVQGIFRFDISVNDSLDFAVGSVGNMGSDSRTWNQLSASLYTMQGNSYKLHYNHNRDTASTIEQFFAYIVPYEPSKNGDTRPYTSSIQTGDYWAYATNPLKGGVNIYYAKTNDVKNWVINDLTF